MKGSENKREGAERQDAMKKAAIERRYARH